jgi:phospholipase/carboxylesterase
MRKIGPLQCISIDPKIEPKAGQSPQYFIIFHGYGADAYDLQSLSEAFDLKIPTFFLFMQGILEVPIGPGWTGRAWWNIDVQALQEAQLRGTPRDLSKERPATVPELRQKVFAAIATLGVPWNQIILGGFSQGAMLATDIFLNAPENPKALVSMSGALVNKDEWKTLVNKRAGVPFFMCHGKSDAVLDIRGSSQLESLLIGAGLKGKLTSFEGSHEIPFPMIQKINEFINQL